jgi:hypothetical protein
LTDRHVLDYDVFAMSPNRPALFDAAVAVVSLHHAEHPGPVIAQGRLRATGALYRHPPDLTNHDIDIYTVHR